MCRHPPPLGNCDLLHMRIHHKALDKKLHRVRKWRHIKKRNISLNDVRVFLIFKEVSGIAPTYINNIWQNWTHPLGHQMRTCCRSSILIRYMEHRPSDSNILLIVPILWNALCQEIQMAVPVAFHKQVKSVCIHRLD